MDADSTQQVDNSRKSQSNGGTRRSSRMSTSSTARYNKRASVAQASSELVNIIQYHVEDKYKADEIGNAESPATTSSGPPRDYMLRRLELLKQNARRSKGDQADDNGMPTANKFVINRLDLNNQAIFRRKMLVILAIQLFFVASLVAILSYVPDLQKLVKERFENIGNIAVAFAVACALLLFLYRLRHYFPVNWIILLLFSVSQSVFYAALGVPFESKIGVFNCCLSFCIVLLMIIFSGFKTTDGNGKPVLISSILAGLLAYAICAIISIVLFIVFRHENIVTDLGFGLTLVVQLVIVLWFSNDTQDMYRVMTPDEYMYGVIYCYTDLVMLVALLLIGTGMLILIGALTGGDGAGMTFACTLLYCPSCECCNLCGMIRENDDDELESGNGEPNVIEIVRE